VNADIFRLTLLCLFVWYSVTAAPIVANTGETWGQAIAEATVFLTATALITLLSTVLGFVIFNTGWWCWCKARDAWNARKATAEEVV